MRAAASAFHLRSGTTDALGGAGSRASPAPCRVLSAPIGKMSNFHIGLALSKIIWYRAVLTARISGRGARRQENGRVGAPTAVAASFFFSANYNVGRNGLYWV